MTRSDTIPRWIHRFYKPLRRLIETRSIARLAVHTVPGKELDGSLDPRLVVRLGMRGFWILFLKQTLSELEMVPLWPGLAIHLWVRVEGWVFEETWLIVAVHDFAGVWVKLFCNEAIKKVSALKLPPKSPFLSGPANKNVGKWWFMIDATVPLGLERKGLALVLQSFFSLEHASWDQKSSLCLIP